MFSREVFARRLRALRKGAGEKQERLAEVLGVTTTQISDMENGKTTTTLEKFVLICEHYRVSADYLLGLRNEP